jgi:ribonuclease HII
VKPDFQKEKELWNLGFKYVCGIDEAGRGAIAGPLVASAVILRPKSKACYNDSKLLSAKTRETLCLKIKKTALCWSVGISSVEEINRFGIQSATYMAYERAYLALDPLPDFLLIDHYHFPKKDIPQAPITKGDQKSQSIAAASIVAKVTRDRIMSDISIEYPDYGFEKHMGYGTAYHLKQLKLCGSCDLHRTDFIDKASANQLNFTYSNKNRQKKESL